MSRFHTRSQRSSNLISLELDFCRVERRRKKKPATVEEVEEIEKIDMDDNQNNQFKDNPRNR